MFPIVTVLYTDNSFLSIQVKDMIASHSGIFDCQFLTLSDLMKRDDIRKCCGGPKLPWLEVANIITPYRGQKALQKVELLIKQFGGNNE